MVGRKNIIFSVLAVFMLLLSACANTERRVVSLPPVAESPSIETIFGEATIGQNKLKPIDVPQTAPNSVLSLKDCLELAAKVSPTLDSADQSYIGAMWNRWSAVTNFLPQGSAQYGITHLDKSPTGGLFNTIQGDRNLHTLNISVTQPLFTGYQNTAAYLLSQLGVSVAEIQKTQAREDLALKVKQSYYQILAVEKALEVAKQTVVSLRSHVSVAQNFFEVGMVPKNQVLEAEVKLAKAIQDETVQTHDLIVAKTNLNILLRQDQNKHLKLKDILQYRSFPLTLEQCLEISLSEKPELKVARKQVEMGAQNINMARSGYYPNLSVSYNAERAGKNENLSGTLNRDARSWNVALVASFNFWEWGRTKSKVEQSKVEMNKAINTLTELEDATKLDVTSNYQRLVAAGKNINVSSQAVSAASENLRMVTERYAEQVATNTEVLDAQTSYSNAQYEYYKALYDYNLSWAALERSLGRQVNS